MRILTAISGIVLAAVGAFCFAFYMNGFAGIAFILGVGLVVEGVCHILGYAIGFRKSVLPDTVLVEGGFSAALGAAILMNMVTESQIALLFGMWLLVSGITRFSQSLAVSKINPRNWFAVVPLALINTMLGFVMLMPNVLHDVNILWLVAVAYILNGFSILVYVLYMVKKADSKKAIEARKRADAKKKAAEEKRKKRDEFRSLSEAERQAVLADAKANKKQFQDDRKAERAAAREAERAKRRPASEQTVQLTDEEVAEINEAANRNEKSSQISFDDIWEGKDPDEKEAKQDLTVKPVWNKPENIPHFEKSETKETAKDSIKLDSLSEKRTIVNLEEIENEIPNLQFEEVDLPEVKLKSEGGESMKRRAFLLELEDEPADESNIDDLSNLSPLTLEELFADERYNIKPLTDRRATETDLKLTQTFTFDWLNKKI